MPFLAAAALLLVGCQTAPVAMAGEGPCKPYRHADRDYTVCTVDPREQRLELFWKDDNDRPYGSFRHLVERLEPGRLVFAMNAGMYDRDLAPVGLYVESGETLQQANTADGPGNFHMKPNGVFFVRDGEAGVLVTERFLAEAPDVELATQSGPMLVIEGRIHHRFIPHSRSRKRRNGVGVRDDGLVVFAISEETVNFHEFARLFRDGLGADNALFLDGTMSSLYAPHLGRADRRRAMGPIIGVREPE